MVTKLTLKRGRASANHNHSEPIKHLKQKLEFATRQRAAVTAGKWGDSPQDGTSSWDKPWGPDEVWDGNIWNNSKRTGLKNPVTAIKRTATTKVRDRGDQALSQRLYLPPISKPCQNG